MCKDPEAGRTFDSQGIKSPVWLESSEYSWEAGARTMIWDRLGWRVHGSVDFWGSWRQEKALGSLQRDQQDLILLQQSLWLCYEKLFVGEIIIEARKLVGGCCSITETGGLDHGGGLAEGEKEVDSGCILVIKSVGLPDVLHAWMRKKKRIKNDCGCLWLV